jgi:hypothetical protein
MNFRKTTLVALTALMATGAALAETSPWYVGVLQTFTHDNNLYRVGDNATLPAGYTKADTVSSTSLVAGINQPVGRQRVYGSLNLSDNRYANNKSLNTPSHTLNLGLDWDTIERLSGNLNYGNNKSLMQFNSYDSTGKPETLKNLVTSQSLDALARLGVVTKLTAELGLGHSSVGYSAQAYQLREYRQTYESLGLKYRPSGLLTLGTAFRQTQGSYPKFRQDTTTGAFTADDFTRQDLDFTANWQPSGISTVSARVSATRTKYDVDTQRNGNGLTGYVAWDWQATGKLMLRSNVWRDFGQRSDATNYGFYGPGYVDAATTTEGVRLRAEQELTGKIALTAGLQQSHRVMSNTYAISQGTLGAANGSENSTVFSLGARWTPLRSATVGCDINRERRSSDGKLSASMSDATYACYGQFTLQ